jgi:CRISPR/Cas system-associated exonuclease Cas4 (RecB family)
VFTHSHSSVSKFEVCPRQFETRYILGNKEPATEAMTWGTRVHAALEAKVNGDPAPLPEGMEKMEWAVAPALAAKARGMLVLNEHRLALDRYMKPVTFDSKLAWVRGILDQLILSNGHAFINDYKTGKHRPSWQLELASLIVFYTYPEIERIEARYLYVKDPIVQTRTDKTVYFRGQTPHMAGAIFPRIIKVEKALELGKFDPKPSGLCKQYCSVTSCEFNGRRG